MDISFHHEKEVVLRLGALTRYFYETKLVNSMIFFHSHSKLPNRVHVTA